MADDEKTRWAIDVMTAWIDERDDDLLHARIDSYLHEAGGARVHRKSCRPSR
ncbi:MAG: hypothetical protein SW019_16960 [Actinomycetota bacterium]|nr:hypothetical protein [Actinomycetota bacterium]